MVKRFPLTNVIISGYIGFNNFGDEAVLNVLIDNLNKEEKNVTVITSNPEFTEKLYNVKTVKTFDILGIILNLMFADVLISGGGSLLQDKTSLKSLLYYLFVIFTAKILGKKVIIYAQGIGPVANGFVLILTKFALKIADLITVRDEKSLFLLRGWGVNPDLQPDPVFNLQVPMSEAKMQIGVQLRDWKFLTDDFLETLAKNLVMEFPSYEILLISFHDDYDITVLDKFKTMLLKINPVLKIETVKNSNQISTVNNFKNLEYLIAMRFHACLIGIKSAIKTMAISYDEKVEKLAREADIPYVTLDRVDLIADKIRILKTLKTAALLDFANNRKFDFEKINLFLK